MTYANISIPVFSIVGEHKQAEYLSAEIEKIRLTLEMIERSEKQSAHMDRRIR
jgi:hypothetical protein